MLDADFALMIEAQHQIVGGKKFSLDAEEFPTFFEFYQEIARYLCDANRVTVVVPPNMRDNELPSHPRIARLIISGPHQGDAWLRLEAMELLCPKSNDRRFIAPRDVPTVGELGFEIAKTMCRHKWQISSAEFKRRNSSRVSSINSSFSLH